MNLMIHRQETIQDILPVLMEAVSRGSSYSMISVVDGQTYELQIEHGVDRNSDIDFEEYSFFKGETPS